MILTPHSGGLESKDFVKIFLKMMEKYLQNNNIKYDIKEITDFNSVLNIKNPNPKIIELNGLLKLVRVSPYGKNDKVHTSLISINMVENQKKKCVTIEKNDLIWNYFKSPGPGGQKKNKTLSAVRLVHISTNIVVIACQERSQNDNKMQALKQLEMELNKKENNKELLSKSKIWNDKLNIENELITFYFNHNFVINNKKQIKSLDMKKILNGNLDLIL